MGFPEARAGKSVMCRDYFIRLVDVSACAQQGSALDPCSQAASSLSSLTSPLGCSPTLGCSRAPIRICLKFAIDLESKAGTVCSSSRASRGTFVAGRVGRLTED